jgi:hypothetical protein
LADDNKGPDIRLSGYLPGTELNGLGLVKDALWAHFEEAWRNGDTTREGLRVPVVAVLEVQTVKVPVPGSDDQPTVNVKVLMVEPATEVDEQKQITSLLTELRGRRRGDQPGLFDADGMPTEQGAPLTVVAETGGEATSSSGTATSRKPRRRGPGVQPGEASAE